MISHRQAWRQIDQLAKRHGLTPSGLARRAGLDATTFNPSKRISKEGRERWPTLESVAKAAAAVGEDLGVVFAAAEIAYAPSKRDARIPLIGFAEAGAGGYFDNDGAPTGAGWEEISVPALLPEGCFALEVSGDSMLPLYRDHDILIASHTEQIRRGDRVVVRTSEGEAMAKVLFRETADRYELHSFNPDHPPRTVAKSDVASIARILWVSQ
ncbi:MAG: helix-turn-helix transcriptional regulator [Hyphomicrobiaceae bacterium]|nr:helix-turn-helix transcriptional regulator [Hyphomicrobiaceae bacterium]